MAAASHAGSAFEGGARVAIDPRDLESDAEDARQGGRAPRLTIMEEVLLLGLKDKQASGFFFGVAHEGRLGAWRGVCAAGEGCGMAGRGH